MNNKSWRWQFISIPGGVFEAVDEMDTGSLHVRTPMGRLPPAVLCLSSLVEATARGRSLNATLPLLWRSLLEGGNEVKYTVVVITA